MIALTRRTLARLEDRANPIVVKEARQAVRSRWIITMLALELVALLLLTAGAAIFGIGNPSNDFDGTGFEVFMTINGGLMLLCTLAVPAYVAARLGSERTGAAADLLYTTSIGPASIVWGKTAVAMMIATLLVSAAAPFLVVSYLLRGIDLPTIAFIIGFDFVVILFCAQLAITIAALPVSAILRIFAGILAVPAILYLGGGLMSSVFFFGGVSVASFDADVWKGVAAFVVIAVGLSGMLFVLTVAMLAPTHTDRAVLARTYTTAFWAITGAIAFFTAVDTASADAVGIWATIWTLIASASLALAAGERRQFASRLLRRIPRNPILRPIRVLFMSGAATGLLWSTLLAAATIATWYTVAATTDATGISLSGRENTIIFSVIPIPLYTLAICLLAVWTRDTFLRRWLSHSMTTGVAVLYFGLACTVPLVTAAILDPRNWEYSSVAAAIAPVGPAIFSDIADAALMGVLISSFAAGLLVLLHARWFFRQLAAYRPVRAEIDQPDAVTVPGSALDQDADSDPDRTPTPGPSA
jgi:hypothetical protein